MNGAEAVPACLSHLSQFKGRQSQGRGCPVSDQRTGVRKKKRDRGIPSVARAKGDKRSISDALTTQPIAKTDKSQAQQ